MQERRSFGWFVSQSLISSCGTSTPFLLEDIFCLDSTAMEKQLTSSKIENLYVNPAKIIKGQLVSLSLTTPKQDRIQIKKLLCVRFQGFWIELVVRTTHNYPFLCVAPIQFWFILESGFLWDKKRKVPVRGLLIRFMRPEPVLVGRIYSCCT